MYKIASIARFRKDMTTQEASDYWSGTHASAMRLVTPLAGYVQSHVAGPLPSVTGVADEETFFDGYACAWWDSRSDFEQAMTTPEWRVVVEDGENVFDMDWLWNMSAHLEEKTVIDGPPGPYKVVWVVRFKQGISRADAGEYWATTHGSIFTQLDIGRYVQNHVVGPVGAEGEVPNVEIGFDGFSECWFRDEQHFLDTVGSKTWAGAVEDASNVFDLTQLWGAVLKENVVVPPPVTSRA
jgi:hypothetical protein